MPKAKTVAPSDPRRYGKEREDEHLLDQLDMMPLESRRIDSIEAGQAKRSVPNHGENKQQPVT